MLACLFTCYVSAINVCTLFRNAIAYEYIMCEYIEMYIKCKHKTLNMVWESIHVSVNANKNIVAVTIAAAVIVDDKLMWK